MDKTISITIGGLLFSITEDAYKYLSAYLEKLSLNLKGQDGAKEIQEDIEARIAELCSALLEKDKKNVIFIDNISDILDQMGDPDEFIEETEQEETKVYQSDKKLFRDLEKGYIGGVCVGIATYLNLPVLLLRIVFLLTFFGMGSGIIIYLILWILLPEAKTAGDRLQMKGEHVTLKNIQATIQEKAAEVNTHKSREKISGFFKNTIHPILRVVLTFIGIGMIFMGLTGLCVLLLFTFQDNVFNNAETTGIFISFFQLSTAFFTTTFDQNLSVITFLVSSTIPLLFLITLGIHLLLRKKSKGLNYIYLSLLGIWILSIGSGFFLSVKGIQYFSNSEQIVANKSYHVKTDTLLLVSKPFNTNYETKSIIKDDDDYRNDLYIYREGNLIFINRPTVTILPSPDSLVYIKTIAKSYAKNNKKARQYAQEITYHTNLQGNKILLDAAYSFPKDQKIRGQQVQTEIYLPEGKTIYFQPHTEEMLDNISNHHFWWDDDVINNYWTMKNGTLTCYGCTNYE